ncbi:MAG: DUF2062 domain-containing protein [Pseudomonadota bacterium]
MVFKRRDKLHWAVWLKELFVPRKGWRRGLNYLGLRMQRLPDSAHAVALGFGCGVFASFTPFFGFHFVIAAAIAWIVRGNLYASAIGTFFGNPLTFGFIMWISLKMGGLIMGVDESVAQQFKELGFIDKVIYLLENIHTLVVPYFVGGLIPGAIMGTISYYLMRPIVRTYQERRRKKLLNRAKARLRGRAATPAE